MVELKYLYMTYLVSVIICTLNEIGYIERTLLNLVQQTLYKKGQMEILIGDFKDRLNMDDNRLPDICSKIEHVRYMPLFQKGIAWSRNQIIKNMATSNIFLILDADSRFNRPDGAEMLIHPILNGEAQLTNCDVLFMDDKTGKVMTNPSNFYEFAANVANVLERGLFARSSGLTVSRQAFMEVGGFREDLKLITEDWMMAIDVISAYGYPSKKFIDGVKIFASDRRAKAFNKDGFDVLSYGNKDYR